MGAAGRRAAPGRARLVPGLIAALLLAPLAAPARARADAGEVARAGGLFAGGVATAFALHEGCHVAANLALGNVPRLEGVRFAGAIPFFAVSPGIRCFGGRCTTRSGGAFGPGPRGLGVILTAGLQCQGLADEVLLTQDPELRHHAAPFRTGMLAFGTLASLAYVVADAAGVEPSAGDLADLYRDTRAPRAVTGALLAGAAACDLARYLLPSAPVLPWVSRGSKLALAGLVLTF